MFSSGSIEIFVFAAIGALLVFLWPVYILWDYLRNKNAEDAWYGGFMYVCCVIVPTVCFILLQLLFDTKNWVKLPKKADDPTHTDWSVVFVYAVFCTAVFDGLCLWVLSYTPY